MEPDASARALFLASVLMTKALEDGIAITAEAYGDKCERGAITCAGKRCGVPVVFQVAHCRRHPRGYVEMFAGFRLAKGSRHTVYCDIDVQIGARVRGRVVEATPRVAAAAILAMALNPHGRVGPINERVLRVRWDAEATPHRVIVATPSATLVGATGGPGSGISGPARMSRPRRINSAIDIERVRREIVAAPDSIAAAKELAIILGDDVESGPWNGFYHNWPSNNSKVIEAIVRKIECGASSLGTAFAATVETRPRYRRGAWAVGCRERVSSDGSRRFALWIVVADREIATSLIRGKTYVFAGPEVRHERNNIGGTVYEHVYVGVLSARWIVPSLAPVTQQQAAQLLHKVPHRPMSIPQAAAQ